VPEGIDAQAQQNRTVFLEPSTLVNVSAKQLLAHMSRLLRLSLESTDSTVHQQLFPAIRNVLLQLLRSRGGILLLASDASSVADMIHVLLAASRPYVEHHAKLVGFAMPAISHALVLPDQVVGAYQLAALLSYHLGALCDLDVVLSIPASNSDSQQRAVALQNLHANACAHELGRQSVASVIALTSSLRVVFDLLDAAPWALEPNLAACLILSVLQAEENIDIVLDEGEEIVERLQPILRDLEGTGHESAKQDSSATTPPPPPPPHHIYATLAAIESWLQPAIVCSDEQVCGTCKSLLRQPTDVVCRLYLARYTFVARVTNHHCSTVESLALGRLDCTRPAALPGARAVCRQCDRAVVQRAAAPSNISRCHRPIGRPEHRTGGYDRTVVRCRALLGCNHHNVEPPRQCSNHRVL
jgi:hypothetical protein